MDNINHRIEGEKLIIEVDISPAAIKRAPPSSSGKTKLVGTTGGAVTISPGLTFSINVMHK